MDASIESLDGDILIKFKKLLVEEGYNEISVSGTHNSVYAFSDTVGEGHFLKRGKAVIDFSTREVTAPLATEDDILLNIDVKIRMQYVVSDTDQDVGDVTLVTMAVTFTASNTVGFVALGLPDESGGMVGDQSIVDNPQ